MKKLMTWLAMAGVIFAMAPAATVLAGTPAITDGLMGYWSFDADSAVDDSGNGYNGTWYGTPVYDTSVPPGFSGKSADMTANNTCVCVFTPDTGSGENSVFNLDTLSIAFWTTGGFPGGWENWVCKEGNSGGYRLTNPGTDQMMFGLRGPGDSSKLKPRCWDTTKWWHYVATYDGSQMKLYENGIEIYTGNKSGTVTDNLAALTFGAVDSNTTGTNLSGFAQIQIDEVYVFDRGLTAAEVITLFGASTWDGGAGNWSDAKWSGGNTPVTGQHMIIDAASADSDVTLATDFTSESLALGGSAASALTINSTKTLTLNAYATVGASGTLQVDGTLTTPNLTIDAGGTLNVNGALTTPKLTTSGSITVADGVTLSVDEVTFIGNPSHAVSGTISATTAFKTSSTIQGSQNGIPDENNTVTIGATLTGDAYLAGRNDTWARHRVILTGTNTYTGETRLGSASSIIRADDGVGLPTNSFLKLHAYKQASGMETGADLVRPGGSSGAGKMDIYFADGGGFTAVGAVAGANPVVVCFGTLAAPEQLTWGTAPFRVGNNAGSFGLNGGQAAANNTIDFRNPIDLGDGSSNKKGNILVDSTDYPATMSGVLSGTAGANPNLRKWGNGELILTAKNTYTGGTYVYQGKLTLADDAELRFAIPATTGGNSSIYGGGTVDLNGDFCIDTTAPDATGTDGSAWQLENVTGTCTYGPTFQVVDTSSTPWTDAGDDTWTKTSGGRIYTFDETTGTLTLAIPSGTIFILR